MSLHETRRSPARRIDDTQLLQGLLTQRLYVDEHDRRLLRVLLAETPPQKPTPYRAPLSASARRLRGAGAARARGAALALALSSPLLTAVAASPAPATWVAVADRAADNLAPQADDVLLRALLNHTATARVAVAPADQSDVLLRTLLNHTATTSAAVAPAEQANDVLLRALLNRTTTSQAVAPAEQVLAQADAALAQAELAVGETLVIPAAEAAATTDANLAPLADTVYVVQPGDTLSGIAWAFYGDGNAWWGIFQANAGQIANPHWIYPNQRFVIPGAPYTGAIYTTSTTGTTGYTNWQLNLSPNVRSNSQYTVVWGDTLSQLAYVAYGDGNAWLRIFQANTDKIADPDLIYPGQVFRIP